MPYARINMAEFSRREERDQTIGLLRNDITSVFPEICVFVCVNTLEVFGLTISVYDDEQAANWAISQRYKHQEGKVVCFL